QYVPRQVQVKDPADRWRTVIPDLSFPAGKNKTVIADLTGKFLSTDTRIRIRTNMEIYWDQAFVAATASASPVTVTALRPVAADVHGRGASATSRLDARLPDLYGRLAEGRRLEHGGRGHRGAAAVPWDVALPLRCRRSVPARRYAPAVPRDVQHAASGTGVLQPIAALHQRAPRGRVAVRPGQVPLHGIGQAVVDVEQHANLDRVLDALVAHAGGAERG